MPWLRPIDGFQHQQSAKSTALPKSRTKFSLPRSRSILQTWDAIPTEEDEQDDGEDDDDIDRTRATASFSRRMGPSLPHKKKIVSIQGTSKPIISNDASFSSREASIQEKLVGHEVTSKHGTGTIIQYLHQEGNQYHFLLQVTNVSITL